MARQQIAHALARLQRTPLSDSPIDATFMQGILAAPPGDADADVDVPQQQRRNRLLPPLVTLRLFLMQILHGNVAIAALRQLSGIDFAKSSYCEARDRLQLSTLQSLLAHLHAQAMRVLRILPSLGDGRDGAGNTAATPRILIVDGSTYSMPDTPALRKHFDLPSGTKPGVGYPMGKLMGLLDAATGMFISLLALPLFQHDMRGVASVHPMLRPGDVLLGDRAFCSFCHLALLQARGVFTVMRLHQARKSGKRSKRSERSTSSTSGGGSVRDRWHKPPARSMPKWMDAACFAQLPDILDVRLVRYTIAQLGWRTRHVIVATTLLDEQRWPDARIAALYGQRWQIETCFDHLKTTMQMNVLRCKTVDGVRKELAVYLAAYNLVRLAMLRAAQDQHVADPHRISFVDAMRRLAVQLLGLPGVPRLIVNPRRPGRRQLRVIRRRWKEYDLLTKPRHEAEAERDAELAAKQGETC